MRATFTLLFSLLISTLAWAQPTNNDCATATTLSLGTPSCTASVTNSFSSNNNLGTPSTPFPAFTGCDIGGSTNDIGADVWFNFVATGNSVEIDMSGLAGANVVLFSGDNCAFLTPVECASANGSVTLTGTTFPGNTYYIVVYGNGVADQGNINLTITSLRDCNACYSSENITLIANPPPVNGTYNSGQTVQYCLTIAQWNVTGTIEWLHAVEVDFGPGWDYPNSFTPSPPPSCDGGGNWGWYPNPWTGCNTGLQYGPGFAYDSANGIGCGGAPGDGDPGNNWGDGANGCANIGTGSPPVQFCWSISVNNCPPNTTGDDLGINVNIYSDGDSGSWNQTGCNSGVSFDVLATGICCDDFDPLATPFPTSCPGVNDGSIQMQGSGGIDPFATYNFTVFDSNNNIVFQCDACSGTVSTLQDLAPGQYTVLATNVATGCNRSTLTLVTEGVPPTGIASVSNMPCPGDPAFLLGDVSPFDPFTTYTWSWTGPNSFTSFDQNPTALEPGTYTLTVSANGCPAQPVDVLVEYVVVDAMAFASPNPVCQGSQVELTASGGVSYSWENITTNEFIGPGNPAFATVNVPSTFRVTVTDANGCSETAEVFVDVVALPFVQVDVFPAEPCADETIVLTANGAGPGGMYFWPSISAVINPLVFDPGDLPPGTNTLAVEATDANGCVGMGSVTFTIGAVPTAGVTAQDMVICAGQSTTLTATGGPDYFWSTGPADDFASTITVSPTATTTYMVTVTDPGAAACSDIAEVTVTVEDAIPAPNVSCGTITPNSVEFVWDPVPGAVDYTVTSSTMHTGILSGTTYTVTGLSPGETVTITVSANAAGACPPVPTTFSCQSQDCPTVTIDIDAVADICRDGTNGTITLNATISSSGGTIVWSGIGIEDADNGVFNPLVADVGPNIITLTYVEGQCAYSEELTINVFDIPTADFSVDPTTVCTDQVVTITYTGMAGNNATYNWDFAGGTIASGSDAGPYTISWPTSGPKTITLQVDDNGCTSTLFTQNVNVEEPLTPPTITCGTATTTSVVFEWGAVTGATTYDVNVTSGQGPGSLNGTSYTVDGLAPGTTVDIELTVNTNSVCGPIMVTASCTAADCPTFTIDIDPVADFCSDDVIAAPVDLTATVTGGDGTGTLTWNGPGVTGNTYDPADAGVGLHTLTATYTEGPCVDNASITVTVFQTPEAAFTISNDPICIDQEVTIDFTGMAGATATYAWDFGGATIVSGSDAGPYVLSWPTQGTKTITLSVTENGCTSPTSTETLEVEAPLAAPLINCSPTPNSVTFSWDPVPGAIDHTVTVLVGPSGTQTGNSYEVTGLSAGDVVEIEVTAVGDGPCGNSSATLECTAENCPAVMLDIAAVSDICLTPAVGVVNLTAVISGGAGGGAETWSGPGVTDNDPGAGAVFDPQVAGVGFHTVNLNYQEGNCGYNASIVINIYEIPTASFTIDPVIVCEDQPTTITYTGTAADTASFSWDFGGATILSGTGVGPYEVSWPSAGTPFVTLTVTQNNCVALTETQMLTVTSSLLAPEITCVTTNTTIEFSWLDVVDATGYTVEVLMGPTGTQTGNTYLVEGLLPGDEVTIRVTAETDNPCGPSQAEQSCIASDCLMGTWDIPAIGPLCLDDSPVLVAGTLTIDGMDITSGFSLTGPGAQADGTFDPAVAGVNTHTVCLNFTQGVCDYQACIDIEVNAPPTANFDGSAAVVCVGEEMTLTYTGNASVNATYDWSFDGGTPNPATGQGPINVSWNDAGPKVVTLTVTVNGCVSEEESFAILVEEPLEPLVVNCLATSPTSVVFGWNDIAGATGYTVTVVSGPMGTLDGTTYTVGGLTPGESVEITVTAETNNICGSVSGGETCTAQPCQALTLSLNGTSDICAGEDTQIFFDFTGTPAGPFLVTYTINGGSEQTITLADGGSLDLTAVSEDVTLTIVSIQDTNLPDCSYPSNETWTVAVTQPSSAGVPTEPFVDCENTPNTIALADLLTGEDLGGTWVETSAQSSTGAAFNAAAGTFQTATQGAGTYTFAYSVGGGFCPTVIAEVTVDLVPIPVADAGMAQTLTCNMGMVSIGGSNTSVGGAITYEWTADDPNVMISDPTAGFIEVSQPATYTLTVRNAAGCTASSSVEVNSETETPIAQINLSGISCFQANDGAIIIENVTGGRPPYTYSLNNGPFGTNNFFGSLGPGNYSVIVQDDNGCFTELMLNLSEPDQVVVTLTTNLEGNDPAIAGQPVTLTAVYNPNLNIDTIIWRPDSLGTGNTIQITPTETTSFGVTIIDVNGCSDSDNINLIVEKTRPIFIPNAISPNGDGSNDIFFIQADGRVVEEIQSLMIFNRWGESLFTISQAFPPNDPAFGWDGFHRGQVVNSGVYVYYTKIKFTDGEVVEYKGDIVVVR